MFVAGAGQVGTVPRLGSLEVGASHLSLVWASLSQVSSWQTIISSELSRGLAKPQLAGPHPRILNSVGNAWCQYFAFLGGYFENLQVPHPQQPGTPRQ